MNHTVEYLHVMSRLVFCNNRNAYRLKDTEIKLALPQPRTFII